MNESDSSEHFEDASSPLTSIIPKNPKVLAGNKVKSKLVCKVDCKCIL